MIKNIFSIILFSLIIKNANAQFGVAFAKEFLGQSRYEKASQQTRDYHAFKSENLLTLELLDQSKAASNLSINEIQLLDKKTAKIINLKPEEFIEKFNQKKINPLLINLKRNDKGNTTYRLGNTNYVILLKSEKELAEKFNNKRK